MPDASCQEGCHGPTRPRERAGRARRCSLLLATVAAFSAAFAAVAQPAPKDRGDTRSPAEAALILQARAFTAMEKHQYKTADELLGQAVKTDPGNFVLYYNQACVKALLEDAAASADLLIDAVEHGFTDLDQLKRDPQLVLARKEPRIVKLIEAWPKVLDRHLEANLAACAKLFDGKNGTYRTTRDARLRIGIMSAMDPKATEQASADISRLYDWGLQNVFPELADPKLADQDAWTVVILPTPKDFLRWLVKTYGPAAINDFSGIGGSYLNDEKRLVAQDLGATLRHEFFHVLHWRSAIRHGQDHPVWIQEGLCSLVEDYELGPEGSAASLKPVPSWRTNMAKRIMSGGNLLPIKKLASIQRDRFTGASPLANYAQARTFFLFLLQSGKLKEWYAHYTAHYEDDPTGVKSIEAVFSQPITDVDKSYRAWLRALPTIAEQMKPGSAGLGVDVEQGDGDGPMIAEIPSGGRGRPNAARQAGLRAGDVITAIDGKPTRDLNELVRLLGEHKVGDEVEISYRRGTTHAATKVRLVPRE